MSFSGNNENSALFASDSGFKAFPKHIPEDCVSYSIYVGTKGDPTQLRQLRDRLRAIQTACTSFKRGILNGYIWQREPFGLEVIEAANDTPLHLEGRTSFGDSIADEWVIVYLLRELSVQFKDSWIRCEDADGEFLLIEAANVLPTWLEPDVGKNRVWIHNGSLHILPRDVGLVETRQPTSKAKNRRKEASTPISLSQALEFITERPEDMIRSPSIQEEAFYRIRNYPARISEIFHITQIVLPRKLAHIIHRTPTHVNPAVEAFYLRDPISLKILQPGSTNELSFPPEDLVTTSVKFTRVDYAQLRSQEFASPSHWDDIIEESKSSVDQIRKDTGMKLACGFEMLISDPQNQDQISVREIKLLLEDLQSGEEMLPTDEQIKDWGTSDESESWLDVNFEDFDDELSGRKSSKKDGKTPTNGFGDKAAQENLQRIVERFQQLLQEDEGGHGNAFFDDDYNDLDSADEDEEDSNDPEDDRDVSFDDEDLARAMREMMGMPAPQASASIARATVSERRVQEIGEDDNDEAAVEAENPKQMREDIERMEAELRDAGVLSLDRGTEDTDEKDPKYLLAKNFLESFKGQAGFSGPAGNFISSLGMKFPLDRDDI